MKKDIYIGIDGGGTKCALRMEDADGNVLAETQSGPANISQSVRGAWASILDACQLAGVNVGEHNVHVGLGLAGSEDSQALAEFLSIPHEFHSLVLKSDAHAACLGAHGGEDGAIIISGTGVVGYSMQSDDVSKVSGWGFALGDVGSGAWLGYQAIRCMLKWRDGRASATPLLQALYDEVGHDVVSFSRQATSTAYADFAPLVIQYKTDPVAHHLLTLAGEEIESLYKTLSKGVDTLPLCLLGGVAEHLVPYLSVGLISNMVPPKGNATEGAIAMVREGECA